VAPLFQAYLRRHSFPDRHDAVNTLCLERAWFGETLRSNERAAVTILSATTNEGFLRSAGAKDRAKLGPTSVTAEMTWGLMWIPILSSLPRERRIHRIQQMNGLPSPQELFSYNRHDVVGSWTSQLLVFATCKLHAAAILIDHATDAIASISNSPSRGMRDTSTSDLRRDQPCVWAQMLCYGRPTHLAGL